MRTSCENRTVIKVVSESNRLRCFMDDGTTLGLPAFLSRFVTRYDSLLHPGSDCVMIHRARCRMGFEYLLYVTIGYVALAKHAGNSVGLLCRAELPKGSGDLDSLFLSSDSIQRYFYKLHDGKGLNELYAVLGADKLATMADLRMAWRVRDLEFATEPTNPASRACERAYNILAHPELRSCYDAIRQDEDAAPVFPYGGFGSILVEGNLSDDGEAFFGNHILAYKPEMTSRKLSVLLRRCNFLADRVTCVDARRKIEIHFDSCLLGGLQWDLTWNHWKHWLQSRIVVNATFVRTGKYRYRKGEWILRTWLTALPSRLRVTLPEGLQADVERAKAIHALLGEHGEVVAKIRDEAEKQPIERTQVQDWFDRLGASSHLKPQHATWRPDYEPYYFEQLRRRSTTWFLFRDEYLFEWANVLISEIPQPGHATYVFAKPVDVPAFMRQYSCATREDIRRNRDNIATELGFVGRVIRGRKKRRWLNDVLKLAGEKADYMEVFE